MDLTDYLAVVRKHLGLIVLSTVLGALLAAGVSLLLPKEYEAESQLFVSTQGQDTSAIYQGSNFTQQRVKSYAEAMTSPLVLRPVIQDLGLDMDADDLARSMTVTVPLDTVLIDFAVQGRDPAQVAQIANAVSSRFSEVVPTLENTSAQDSPVRVTVLREAEPPRNASSPNLPVNVAAGAFLGLLVGLGLALLRHLTDTMVRGETDIKGTSDHVVIGGVPFAKDGAAGPLVVHTRPHSPRAEAFRTLRTNLQFVNAAHHARSIVFTSSVPGEGKTTTTANLALVMGESGVKVCVVEADLRRPRLMQHLGLAEGAGLTNLILGDVDYEDVIQPFGSSNVSVIGAGPIPPNPSELLGSPAMGRIISELEKAYDYVIFDAPPLLPVTDAAVLSKQVSGVVVVVGAGVVRKEQLRKTLGLLENVGAEVLGMVLNRLSGKDAGAYSYYNAGYESDPIHDPQAARTSARLSRRSS